MKFYTEAAGVVGTVWRERCLGAGDFLAAAAVEARLRRRLREQPDRTLVELQQGLGEAEGVHFSTQHLWRLLRRMSLPLKKSRSARRSRTGRKTGSGARRGGSK